MSSLSTSKIRLALAVGSKINLMTIYIDLIWEDVNRSSTGGYQLKRKVAQPRSCRA